MTIPLLPAAHAWPMSPAQTFWLTALLGIFLISQLRLPP